MREDPDRPIASALSPRPPRSRFYDGWLYARTLDPLMSGLHQYVADHVEPTRRILDVGCGTGSLVWRLTPKAEEVVGVELSPAMVAYAKERLAERPLGQVSFVLGDVSEAFSSLPDHHFDLATLVMALHEMPEGARTQVLTAVTRLARRAFCIDFRVPMPWNPAGLRNRLFELLAGSDHYRAFRGFQRIGGMAGAAKAAALQFEHVRYIDAGTTEVGFIRRPS